MLVSLGKWKPNRAPDSLFEGVQKTEHLWYPHHIRFFAALLSLHVLVPLVAIGQAASQPTSSSIASRDLLNSTSRNPASSRQIWRDPNAISALRQAVQKLGGLDAITNTNVGKLKACLLTATAALRQVAIWDHASSQFTISNDDGSNGGGDVLKVGDGKITRTDVSKPITRAITEAYFDPFLVANLITESLSDASIILSEEGPVVSGEVSFVGIHITSWSSGSPVSRTVWINQGTGLPQKIDFCTPDLHSSQVCIPHSYELKTFAARGGVLYPNVVEVSRSDQHLYTLQLEEISQKQ
jgi:hypothetical protein